MAVVRKIPCVVRTVTDQFSVRVDHRISAKAQLFARFNWNNVDGPTTNPSQTAIDPSFGVEYRDHQRNVAITATKMTTVMSPPQPATKCDASTNSLVMSGSSPPMSLNIFSNVGMTKIIMTVPTLLVSIPGSSALRTLIYFDRADVTSAIESGVSTVLVVIAMIAGLSGARMLTDPEWAFTRQDPALPDPSKVRTGRR